MENTIVENHKVLNKRHCGIDILRILSMIMIVMLHVLGKGGVLNSCIPLSLNYEIAWWLETAAYCSVNCYALISGYIGGYKYQYANIVGIWLQVLFYEVGINFIVAMIYPGTVTWQIIKNSFFPVTKGSHWYFTAYFVLFFFIPFLEHIVNSMEEKQLKKLSIIIIIFFSIIPTFSQKDLFGVSYGYSLLWLAALYLLGGCIRKCKWFVNIKKYKFVLIYVVCIFFSWGAKYGIEKEIIKNLKTDILILYNSPTILFAAVSLLILCMNIKTIPRIVQKGIDILTPCTFSVYIIHHHPQIWSRIIADRFIDFANYSAIKLVISVLVASLVIYLLCSFIDLFRYYLFRILKLKQRVASIENYITNKFEK